MKLLKRLLGAVIGLIILIALIGLFLPSTVVVARHAHVDAPRATVFALVDSFRYFNAYSPWVDLDPDTRYVFSGPSEDVGAVMEWRSDNASVGNGRQEIIAADPGKRVSIKLEFSGADDAESTFLLDDGKSGGTDVTWQLKMNFGYNLVGRYFGLLLDRMVGPDYEKGLKRLALFAEGFTQLDIAGFSPDRVSLPSQPIVFTASRTTLDPAGMQVSLRAAFAALDSFFSLNEIRPAGKPLVITRNRDEKNGTWSFAAAYPIAADAPADRFAPGIRRETLPATEALTLTLSGADWQENSDIYTKLDLYMQLHGLLKNGDSREIFDGSAVDAGTNAGTAQLVMPVKEKPLQ